MCQTLGYGSRHVDPAYLRKESEEERKMDFFMIVKNVCVCEGKGGGEPPTVDGVASAMRRRARMRMP